MYMYTGRRPFKVLPMHEDVTKALVENATKAFEHDLPESVRQQLYDVETSRVMNIWSGYTTSYRGY